VRREGRDQSRSSRTRPADVSIHAPREGRDWPADHRLRFGYRVSIHAPREGRDAC